MSRPNILIIEDNVDMLSLLALQFEAANFEVRWASNGLEGLAEVSKQQPDLILLDIAMPKMDGLTFCRQVRQQYSLTELPIIMLSAMNDPRERVIGLEAGANDYVGKPYTRAELLLKAQILVRMNKDIRSTQSLLMQYIQPHLQEQAQHYTQTIGERQEGKAVVVMGDLRGFTALTEQAEISKVTHLLDDFFESMVHIIAEHGGIVLDIIGDAFLAVFNLPEPLPVSHQLAIQSAIEMQGIFTLLQPQWAKADMYVGLGIGITSGNIVLGNIGAAGIMRYTAVGLAVNVASRLSSLASDGKILVSKAVYEQTQNIPFLSFEARSAVEIKGLPTPQTIYYVDELPTEKEI